MNRSEKRRLKRNNNEESILLNYMHMTDLCIIGALYDFGLDVDKIGKILKINGDYLEDYAEYIEREGGFGMIKNDDLLYRVKCKIQAMIEDGGMSKAKGIKVLKNEFNLPSAVLSDLWIECKNDRLKGENKENMGQALKYNECLVTSIEEYDEVETPVMDSINNKIPEKEIDNTGMAGIDYDGDRLGNLNELAVIDKTMTIRGKHGIYIRNKDGVTLGSTLYHHKSNITNVKEACSKLYTMKINDIQKQIDALNIELKDIENEGMQQMEKYTEIESVFDLEF